MKSLIALVLIIVLTCFASVIMSYAHADAVIDPKYENRIHIDSSVIGFDSFNRHGFTTGNSIDPVFAFDYKQFKSHIDEIGNVDLFLTPHDVTVDESADVYRSPSGNFIWIQKDVVLVGEDKYIDLKQPEVPPTIQGKDYNSAASLGGENTRSNERYYFANVVEQPTFTTDCSTIFIKNGFATHRFVGVYLDHYYIGSIDLGRDLEKGEILGFGGQRHAVPFDKCFYVTPGGQLIQHDVTQGLNDVWYGLDDQKIYNEHDEQPSRIITQESLDAKMKNAYYLRDNLR